MFYCFGGVYGGFRALASRAAELFVFSGQCPAFIDDKGSGEGQSDGGIFRAAGTKDFVI